MAREQRRAAIAASVIAKKTVTAIAAEHGLARETVSREVNSEETTDLMRNMLKPHRKRLERIVDQAVTAVERAVQSDQAQRAERIRWLQERIERLRQVIAERAEEAESSGHLADVPGMRSGTMVHRLKAIGSGDNARTVDEFEVDTGLLKELREHERQLREELNDFNLKGVERARDLLEMAEGKRGDAETGNPGRRWSGSLEELLDAYRQLTTSDATVQ